VRLASHDNRRNEAAPVLDIPLYGFWQRYIAD